MSISKIEMKSSLKWTRNEHGYFNGDGGGSTLSISFYTRKLNLCSKYARQQRVIVAK